MDIKRGKARNGHSEGMDLRLNVVSFVVKLSWIKPVLSSGERIQHT